MKFCHDNCKTNKQYLQPIEKGEKGEKQTYQHVCTQKCTRAGCPAWHVRSPRTNRCIHRKKQAYQDVCIKSPKSPKRYTHKTYTCHCIQPVHKKIEVSSTVELLNSIEDITSINEVQEYVDSSDPGRPSTYLNGEWWSIPKVLRSGSRMFVPNKILGQGGFGVVFAYKEKGKENQPNTTQNTIALKLVKGKSVADSDCKGTLEYFPKSKKQFLHRNCSSYMTLSLKQIEKTKIIISTGNEFEDFLPPTATPYFINDCNIFTPNPFKSYQQSGRMW